MDQNKVNINGQFLDAGAHCVHSEFCGGCKYDQVPYEEQVKEKAQYVIEQLDSKGAKVEFVDDFVGCPENRRMQYRNKMEYTFGDFVKDGPLCLGMHKIRNFMSIVTVDQCLLVHSDFNEILRYTLDFSVERGYAHYHKRSHSGLLRNLIVRRGERTNQLMVNIVTSSDGEFDNEAWVKGLLALPLENQLVSVYHTYNDSLADAVVPEKVQLIYGQSYYEDVIAGLKFKVGPFSFFQTNVPAAEKLYLDAIDLIEDVEGKRVFDLYCGTGTISQIVARKAKAVLGIELVEEAALLAKESAAENGLDNCQFIAGDVFKVLEEQSQIQKPDVIIVDPPRVGMSEKAVEKIASYGVDEILYISCNPKTMAMNLAQFRTLGYETKLVRGYDNFCRTKHVESVVLMSRVAPTK